MVAIFVLLCRGGQLVYQLTVNWLIGELVDRFIGEAVNRLIGESVNRLIGKSVNR
jgi:hypothetical protein